MVETVAARVYESAVEGRRQFRSALMRERASHLPAYRVHDALCEAVAAAGSYAALGRLVGVSDEYVRNAFLGSRPVTGKLLAYLGFEKIVTYRAIARKDTSND